MNKIMIRTIVFISLAIIGCAHTESTLEEVFKSQSNYKITDDAALSHFFDKYKTNRQIFSHPTLEVNPDLIGNDSLLKVSYIDNRIVAGYIQWILGVDYIQYFIYDKKSKLIHFIYSHLTDEIFHFSIDVIEVYELNGQKKLEIFPIMPKYRAKNIYYGNKYELKDSLGYKYTNVYFFYNPKTSLVNSTIDDYLLMVESMKKSAKTKEKEIDVEFIQLKERR